MYRDKDFNVLLTDARLLFENGDIRKSLELCLKAYDMKQCPKLLRKIDRIKVYIAENEKENVSNWEQEQQSSLHLLKQAKECFHTGNLTESLRLLKEVNKREPSIKIQKKIERIEMALDKGSPVAEINFKLSPSRSVPATQTYDIEADSIHNESHLMEQASEYFRTRAREFRHSGKLADSLRYLKEAFKLHATEELKLKIERLESALDVERCEPLCSYRSHSLSKEVAADAIIREARLLYQMQDFEKCVNLLKIANDIQPSDKILRKIERITSCLPSSNYDDDNTQQKPSDSLGPMDTVTIDDEFCIPKELYEKLYGYQRDGVCWLWSLHKRLPGGILADDMGLGKTVQVIAFLTGLFISTSKLCTALVVMPVSVLLTWEAELKRWAPSLRVFICHDVSRTFRFRGLAEIQRYGGIVLTTYGTLSSSVMDLSVDVNAEPQFLTKKQMDSNFMTMKHFLWTYLVLDEAHKVKNPSAKATKAAHSISAAHYILLTGTAVQNNLEELWSLYDLTHRGRLLGTRKTFKSEYEKPIIRAREKDASHAERVHGHLMAQSLRKLIDPYFLRRTKNEVLCEKNMEDIVTEFSNLSTAEDSQINKLPKKIELVVWVYLKPAQESGYRAFLELDHVKQLILGQNRRSPLVELSILKKLCDHPRLLTTEQYMNLNLTSEPSSNTDDYPKYSLSPAKLIEESGKLAFLHQLMTHFLMESQCHTVLQARTLIFSQSLKFLDLAERVILYINDQLSGTVKHQHRILRLDGRVNKVCERLAIVKRFEMDKTYTVMLLTTQVGGVGLTLTSANRVIILDPSWNPAVDAQAVDRAYRIGQTSNVIVYRLITCNTVEEKIYRRQIFKDSVIRQTTSTTHNKTYSDPFRYFTRQDLHELFSLDNPYTSPTQNQLEQLHDGSEWWSHSDFKPYLNYLTDSGLQKIIFGISFHDLLFSKESTTESHVETDRESEYLKNCLAAAEQAIARECITLQTQSASTKNITNKITQKLNLHHKFNDYLVGQLFKPSKADSRHPMLNEPNLGRPKSESNGATDAKTVISIGGNDDSVDNTPNSVKSVQSDKTDIHPSLEELLTKSMRDMSIAQTETPLKPNIAADASEHSNDYDHAQYANPSPDHSTVESIDDMSVVQTGTPLKPNIAADTSELSNDYDQAKYANPSPDRSIVKSIRDMSISQTGTPLKLTVSNELKQLSQYAPSQSRNSPPNHLNAEMKVPVSQHKPDLCNSLDPRLYRSTPKHVGSKLITFGSPRCKSPPWAYNTYEQFEKSHKEIEDVMYMDISIPVSDEEFTENVHMNSIHEILVKSGILNSPDPYFGKNGGLAISSDVAVQISDSTVSNSSKSESASSDGLEVIEESDIIEASV